MLSVVGIFEVMLISDQLSKMLSEIASSGDIQKQAVKEGMILMDQDGYLKALDGITTLEEVLRVAKQQ